jgi:peptidyl-prolyl cis-trans isomerase SurA
MKRLIFGLCAVILSFVPCAARCEVTNRIVAIVNDDIVTLLDVERYVAVKKKSRYTSMNEYVRNMALREKLDVFIDSLLIKQQAHKLKIEVGDREVDATVEDIRKKNLISESEMKQQLKNENVRYEDFLDGIRTNIARNRVLARDVRQDVNIDDTSLKAYYDAHPDEYTDEEFSLQHIFVSRQRKDGAARAQAALEALEKETSFGDVAREYSDEPSKGDVVSTNKADLIPELRQALQFLIPGTHSTVIQTPYGYHILKLVDVKKGARLPLEEVKDKIREAIFQQESAKRYKAYMSKLKSTSYIEVKI